MSSPHDPSSSSDLLRLNKVLSRAGVCSRRKADEYIASGRVRVNGKIVREMGLKIDPVQDTVTVDNKPVTAPSSAPSSHVYLMLHKPTHVVTTLEDPQNRTTVSDILPARFENKRLFPVGRLDFMSEGLLLMTTDGDLAHRMMHPSWHQEKVYEVLIRGSVDSKKIESIKKGLDLPGKGHIAPVEVKVLHTAGEKTLLRMVLRQGINRQIRRMCERLDWVVLKIKRIRQGPLSLGNLSPGKTRMLTSREITALRNSVGLTGR